MKSIYEYLQLELTLAREAGDKLALKTYQYVIGEVGRQKTKDVSDKAVIQVVKTCRKKTVEAVDQGSATAEELSILTGFCEAYLPVSITESQLKVIAELAIKQGEKDMGGVMNYIRAAVKELNMDMDNALAAKVARSALS